MLHAFARGEIPRLLVLLGKDPVGGCGRGHDAVLPLWWGVTRRTAPLSPYYPETRSANPGILKP